MKASDLLSALDPLPPHVPPDLDVKALVCDSREVAPGSCFVAVPGPATDGHLFIDHAVRNGASVIVAREKLQLPDDVFLIVDPDTVGALARLAARWYDEPARHVKCIGITGTNGKTTTAFLLRHILTAAHHPAGLIGTVEYALGSETIPARQTTPGPLEIHSLLARMRSAGLEYAVMEVSSHALDQRRVDAVPFHAALFTNLTRDHLDYHRTLEDYLEAKLKLFRSLDHSAAAIVNRDDPAASDVVEAAASGRVFTYALDRPADFRPVDVRTSLAGSSFRMTCAGRLQDISTPLVGWHNLYNCAAAIAAAIDLKLPPESIASAVQSFQGVPGRLERIADPQLSVFVDYAHTPDALENVLNALASLAPGRLIVVFGCGGDRDTGKRPRMGAIAERLADHVVVTSDNPRSEDPAEIAQDILAGMTRPDAAQLVLDRREAISAALDFARPDDCVLIAGKGHENYQIFADRRIDFDDRLVVRELLESRRNVS